MLEGKGLGRSNDVGGREKLKISGRIVKPRKLWSDVNYARTPPIEGFRLEVF